MSMERPFKWIYNFIENIRYSIVSHIEFGDNLHMWMICALLTLVDVTIHTGL